MAGILRLNEPLVQHTSWHIGGKVERYYCPEDIEDLSQFLASLPRDEPLTWLGLGSNVLIADSGLKGTLIHTLGMKPSDPILLTPEIVRVCASVPCAKLAKFCAKQGLVGAEFFAGIPGTIGGALFMNAGAFGGETWERVESVEVINRQGEIKKRLPSDYQIAYRSVSAHFAEEWFVAAHFRLASGNASEAQAQIKQLLRKRSETQPIGVFSCGSVFKNPPGDHAARLIEACHLKGFSLGDAQVSQKHANFIINAGHANANEMLQLIQHIQKTVFEKQGVQLHTEVRMLGFDKN